MKKIILQAASYLLVFIVLEIYFYHRLRGVSGGDILYGFGSLIGLIIVTLIAGGVTYNWDFKDKWGIIIGLLLCYSAYGVIVSVWL